MTAHMNRRFGKRLAGVLLAVSVVAVALGADAKAASENGSRRGRLHVAAASDLVYCLEALQVAYSGLAPDVDVTVSTGSSGNFFAQIRHGAPYDVFLSADIRYPRALVDAGLAKGETLRTYAIGRLVLWSTRPEIEVAQGLTSLGSERVRRVAIAQPEHAPYGRAARQVFERSGLWTAVQRKLVLGENIAQTAQFIQTGHADVGLVALSLVRAPRLRGIGRYWLVPDDLHEPLEQAVVLTRRGAANPAAVEFIAFLSKPTAREIFERFGFSLPTESPADAN